LSDDVVVAPAFDEQPAPRRRRRHVRVGRNAVASPVTAAPPFAWLRQSRGPLEILETHVQTHVERGGNSLERFEANPLLTSLHSRDEGVVDADAPSEFPPREAELLAALLEQTRDRVVQICTTHLLGRIWAVRD
jgi:hypothetical protein